MGTRGVWPPIGSLNTNRWLVQDFGYIITMESEAYNYIYIYNFRDMLKWKQETLHNTYFKIPT